MHTPSGRFQPSTRLCLSISDFHPRSFNPAWGVNTILVGLMSFMTGEEMTTGSINASTEERRWLAARSRWWNATGGGSAGRLRPGVNATTRGIGAVKVGDGGLKFRAEWSELDRENWDWIERHKVDPVTGVAAPVEEGEECGTEEKALRRLLEVERATDLGRHTIAGEGQQGLARAAREQGARGWVASHKLLVGGLTVLVYVIFVRLLKDDAA